MRKLLGIGFIAIIIIALGVFSFYYWGVYERGVMAGKVLRISQKGVIFKTYEGKLSLESFGALKGTSPIAESFDFSVEKSNTEVIASLQEVALSGERVNLHFKKRYRRFPWRGDTKYFVTEVERGKGF
ncbi:MAG: 6-phosphogluconate dehydrogenase [Bacteroidetes bacterium]|nr:6-phosphogluconate dehydrogenase [Bacteroidota bacterium]